MTPDQVRAARNMLRLKQIELAALSGISSFTIRNFELGVSRLQSANTRVLKMTLEDAGIIFLNADSEGGPGVRLRAGARP